MQGKVVRITPTDISVTPWPVPSEGMLAGQPVGIKIIYIPTGQFVICNKYRSQHLNRNKALNDLELLVKNNC